MTRKHVLERRQRNRELGEHQARTMCVFCKAKKQTQFWAPFCSEDCQLNDEEVIALMLAIKGLR